MNDDITRLAQQLREFNANMSGVSAAIRQATREIVAIDEVLARRPALDDQEARIDKIRKCIWTAARADELAKALEPFEAFIKHPVVPIMAAIRPEEWTAVATALNNYRRPYQ